MRTIFFKLIIILCCGWSSMQAQPYPSIFGSNNTSWVMAWQNLDVLGVNIITTQGDTSINGMRYNILTIDSPYTEMYAIREDTMEGKVWVRFLNAVEAEDTAEHLAFDYSLDVGDSMKLSPYYTETFIRYHYVDSVRYINGRKHIYFDLGIRAYAENRAPIPAIAQEPFTMIEGIGGNVPPIWKGEYYAIMGNRYLLCSYQNNVQTDYINLRYAGDCENLLDRVGIKENTLQTATIIHPNPTTGFVQITWTADAALLSLYNTTGIKVFQKELKRGANTLDFFELPKGMYIAQISLNGKQVFQQKLVKY